MSKKVWSNSLFMKNRITFYRIPKSKYTFYDLKEIKYKNIYYLNILCRFTFRDSDSRLINRLSFFKEGH